MSAEFRNYLASLPNDFFAKANQFTSKLHHDEYSFIKPEDSRLSQEGRVVVITGGSSGLGRKGFAPSFARAGAKAIYLVSRKEAQLKEAEAEIKAVNPAIKVVTKAMSVTDESAAVELFEDIKKQYGKADVLINCAGIGGGGSIVSADASLDALWTDFEVNVKGTIIMTRYFSKSLGAADKGCIINVTSAAGPFFIPGTDSYGLTKLAQVQMQRYISSSSAGRIQAVSLNPGSVLTGITKAGFERFSIDTPALAGAVGVWLTSPEAQFLDGRYVDANWDVEEILSRKDEIVKDGLLLMELKGDFSKGRA